MLYEDLYEISKLLLAEDDAERAPEVLLRRIVERCGAETGFVVVREDGSYQQKFEVGEERGRRSDLERRFSRTLVREAIATGELLYLPNLIEDPRFAAGESGLVIGRCCVLVAPLRYAGEVYGVVYLENRERVDSFTPESRAFLTELAEIAGLFLKRASDREELRRRNRSLERDLFAQHDFEGIVTRDPRMLELLRVVAQVAGADAPVLVLGETGTGKELIARALHVNSPRRGRPFVTVHCSALPGTLLESELFGHVAGAFTDAKTRPPGPPRLGPRRHPVPRRGGRDPHRGAGEAAALPPVRRDPAPGVRPHGEGGRQDRRRHPSRPAADGEREALPRGSLLPPQGARPDAAASARAPGGRAAPRRSFPAAVLAAPRREAALDSAGRAGASGPIRIRATSASWRTPSSGPACSPAGRISTSTCCRRRWRAWRAIQRPSRPSPR